MTIANAAGARIEGGIQGGNDKFKVLIVDDSAVIRGLVGRWLRDEPSISVVATASNGLIALEALDDHEVDVVILDIEMPEMDGMTALPMLLRKDPDLKIIMSSTLTADGAAVTLRALSLGAADYVPKPTTTIGLQSSDNFRQQLVEKVKALGAARQDRGELEPASKDGDTAPIPRLYADKRVKLRLAPQAFKPQIIAVGSSTGGPQALSNFFSGLKAPLEVPMVVTQHMPPMFTKLLAGHLARLSKVPITEAVEGEAVENGHVYLAPGDYHLTVAAERGKKVIRLNQDPPENFCRPALDVMLRSVVHSYDSSILTVILTGMGSDGRKGAEAVVESGGVVIAQDQATSVVWGMPGAVATAGLCSAVLPLEDVAPAVMRIASGEAL